MICPNCKYNPAIDSVDDLGRWWTLWEPETDVMARRTNFFDEKIKADVYACPKCKLLFVDA